MSGERKELIMSDFGNKEVMAKNIQHYMELNGVRAVDICADLGFKKSTFSNWINAKIYPRIDKIEMMAEYFHILKSDLIEDKATTTEDNTIDLSDLTEENRKKALVYIYKLLELQKLEEDQ